MGPPSRRGPTTPADPDCWKTVAADLIQRPRAGAVSVEGTNLWIC